jgi:hypothetical protein
VAFHDRQRKMLEVNDEPEWLEAEWVSGSVSVTWRISRHQAAPSRRH